jgi:tetratricopeptide (TPR) repeat protein
MLMWILLPTATLFAQDAMDIQIAHEYLLKGQKEKALESYQILAKKNENIPNIHDDYLGLLLDLGLYKQAETYVEKLLKSNDKLNYRLDLGIVYQRQGDLTKSDKYFKNTIRQSADDVFKLKSISDYLASKDLTLYSISAIQQARETSKSPTLFALELANLFRRSGRTNEMVNEYLNFITQTPTNLGYVKNILQALLTKENELEALETLLYSKIQSAPDNQNYAELIIWVNLQQKNFLGAFVQARAFDKRFRKDNSKTFEIAQIAFNNKSYDAAEKSYQFVIKEYTDINIFLQAKIGLLKTMEARVK